jgi:transposase
MSYLERANRFQQQLFSSLDDQVAKDSIVRIIDAVIDKICENEIFHKEKETEVGRPEYPRECLLKLYVYGYMHRIKSSRKLERECKVNLEVIWLMGKLQPDHWTISFFRKENQVEIKRALKALNKFLMESGYLEGKTIVIDGTKIKANASINGNMHINEIKERLEDLENKITYYLEVFNKADEQEDQQEEIEKLKQQKEELLKQIEKLKEEKKKVYISTDPDANIIRAKEGTIAGYNAQFSCDEKNKLIVATDVSYQANDFKQLKNMYEKTKEMLNGNKPKEVIADAGYYSADEIQKIEEEKVDAYIAEPPEQAKGEFIYDKQKDEYRCNQGRMLRYESQNVKKGRKVKIYRTTECDGCSVRSQCTRSKSGRIKIRYINQGFRDEYRQKMRTEESKEKIKIRKTIVEHPIGIIKLWLGKNPILLRGIHKVKTEIQLVVFSYNILRIFNIDGFDKLNEKVEKYNWRSA